MSNLLNNKIQTPDGTILESRHRHDYKTHEDANGKTYMIDGGLAYVRSSAHDDQVWLGCYDDDPHEMIRQRFTWGTRGKSGGEPVSLKALADMSTDHINAIIDNCGLNDSLKGVFVNELKYRIALDESENR